jgi:hypothetical protein
MNILLLNPWITDFAAFDLWTRPLNLLRFASVLRQHGCQVRLFDCLDRFSPLLDGVKIQRHRMNEYGCGHYHQEEIPLPDVLSFVPRAYKRFGIPKDRVLAELRTYSKPDVIVVATMMTYWYPGVFEAIAMLREIFPGVPIAIGGIYTSLCQDYVCACSGADHILIAHNWPDIAKKLIQCVTGDECEPIGDHTSWIEPAYDLLPVSSSYPVLTSVGCPFHCTYCATHAIWPVFHQYDPMEVVDSIAMLVSKYQAADIAFFDDALLIGSKKHFLVIMEEVVRRGLSVRFHTPNAIHVRSIDRETAQLMKRVNFKTIRLALETANPDWQKNTGSKVFNHEYVSAMQCLSEAGFTALELGTYILYGLPFEPMKVVLEACEIAVRYGSEIKIAMYSPVPGTNLYEQDRHDFLFDPKADPLLQNNSLAPWRTGEISYSEYQIFKKKIAELNGQLREKAISG